MYSPLRMRFLSIGLVCALAATEAASATVTGPITGGNHGWAFGSMSNVDLAQMDYVELEYFIEGTASSYAKNGAWNRDGVWSAAPSGSAPFRTRMLVLRPAMPQAFNGTVVVEWLNVTSGWDNPEVLAHANKAIIRGGFAWVGVSAQALGVQLSPFSLKAWDPARYGSLAHPGDAYAYDIVTQVAQAIRQPVGVNPLEGFAVSRVVATGHSQSANGLTTYVNAVQPLTNAFDSFLLHSRTASPMALFPGAGGTVPPASNIRADTAVPVIVVQDEWTVAAAGAWLNRQPDGPLFRLWEVAGTAHIDRDSLRFTQDIVERDLGITTPPCALPTNQAPMRYVVDAALVSLSDWIGGSGPAAHAPSFIEMAAGAIVRDSDGNAKGGVRLPQTDVPVATYSGIGNGGPGPCPVAGTTLPFDTQRLSYLYPTNGSYRSKFVRAVNALVRSGFLLDADADEAKEQ